MRFFPLLVATLILLAALGGVASSGDAPFDHPANWGGTGLLEIPNARVIPYGHGRAGVAQVHPYRYYYGVLSPFPGIEIGGRVTEIIGVGVPETWKNYGYYKDRAVDLKVQILPEGKYRPAIALGVMDPFGTRLYGAQYVVLSKQIFPFDFTLGVGSGRLGRKPLDEGGSGFELFHSPGIWKDVRLFGGVEFAPSEKFSLILEYSPILYHRHTQDPAQPKYFRSEVPSPINFGLRLKPFRFLDVTLSYQRGEVFGINGSVDLEIGKPLYPVVAQPYEEPEERVFLPIEERVAMALLDMGFSDVGVLKEGNWLYVEFQNDTYLYAPRAIGMVLWTLQGLLPEGVGEVELLYKVEGVPLFAITFSREDLIDFYNGRLTLDEFYSLCRFDFDPIEPPRRTKPRGLKRFTYRYKPAFYTFLNDPSGFFKYRAGAEVWGRYRLGRRTALAAGVGVFPINNISSAIRPLSIPVRSDIVDYIDNKFLLEYLMLEHTRRFPGQLFGYVGAGYLEVQYAGVNIQGAKSLFDGRLLVGFDTSLVVKRAPDEILGLKEKTYYTLLAKARWHTPVEGLSVDLKAGRFLAGDSGLRIQLNKDFKGVIISVWYSFTDTSVFDDPYNRNYHDKGIMVSIPLQMFLGRDSRDRALYALSPWTRDVAQDTYHRDVFDLMDEGSKLMLDKKRNDVRVWEDWKEGGWE